MTSPVSAIEAIEKLDDLLDRYFQIGVQQGLEQRAHDDREGSAQDACEEIRSVFLSLAGQAEALQREMAALLEAEALSGIRALVAGWNGEHLPENERFGRHHDELGVKLPTTCGAIYALDEAMTRARALLGGENAGN